MRGLRQAAALVAGVLLTATSAAAQLSVTSEAVQERSASAGESYAGQVRVRNAGTEAQEVRLFLTGYTFTVAGGSQYAAPDSQRLSNAAWLRLPSSVVVSPGSEAIIAYEVEVPAAVSAGATYWTMLMVEPVAPPSAGVVDPTSFEIRTVTRFGVQIATHVRGHAEPRLRLGKPQVVAGANGSRHLVFEVLNDGEPAYRPKVVVDLFNAAGESVASLSAQRGLLYAGTSVLQRFDLATVPAGSYEALVTVDAGATEVFGSQFRLVLER